MISAGKLHKCTRHYRKCTKKFMYFYLLTIFYIFLNFYSVIMASYTKLLPIDVICILNNVQFFFFNPRSLVYVYFMYSPFLLAVLNIFPSTYALVQ